MGPIHADSSHITISTLARIDREIADAVRNRTRKLVNGHDAQVLEGRWYDNLLQQDGERTPVLRLLYRSLTAP